MTYTKTEIEQHIAHLENSIKEKRKLGYNLRNDAYVRYLTKNLKSWKDELGKLDKPKDEFDPDADVRNRTPLTHGQHKNLDKNENAVELIEYKDGSIALADRNGGESFIYLYPEQLVKLELALQTKRLEELREKMSGCPRP